MMFGLSSVLGSTPSPNDGSLALPEKKVLCFPWIGGDDAIEPTDRDLKEEDRTCLQLVEKSVLDEQFGIVDETQWSYTPPEFVIDESIRGWIDESLPAGSFVSNVALRGVNALKVVQGTDLASVVVEVEIAERPIGTQKKCEKPKPKPIHPNVIIRKKTDLPTQRVEFRQLYVDLTAWYFEKKRPSLKSAPQAIFDLDQRLVRISNPRQIHPTDFGFILNLISQGFRLVDPFIQNALTALFLSSYHGSLFNKLKKLFQNHLDPKKPEFNFAFVFNTMCVLPRDKWQDKDLVQLLHDFNIYFHFKESLGLQLIVNAIKNKKLTLDQVEMLLQILSWRSNRCTSDTRITNQFKVFKILHEMHPHLQFAVGEGTLILPIMRPRECKKLFLPETQETIEAIFEAFGACHALDIDLESFKPHPEEHLEAFDLVDIRVPNAFIEGYSLLLAEEHVKPSFNTLQLLLTHLPHFLQSNEDPTRSQKVVSMLLIMLSRALLAPPHKEERFSNFIRIVNCFKKCSQKELTDQFKKVLMSYVLSLDASLLHEAFQKGKSFFLSFDDLVREFIVRERRDVVQSSKDLQCVRVHLVAPETIWKAYIVFLDIDEAVRAWHQAEHLKLQSCLSYNVDPQFFLQFITRLSRSQRPSHHELVVNLCKPIDASQLPEEIRAFIKIEQKLKKKRLYEEYPKNPTLEKLKALLDQYEEEDRAQLIPHFTSLTLPTNSKICTHEGCIALFNHPSIVPLFSLEPAKLINTSVYCQFMQKNDRMKRALLESSIQYLRTINYLKMDLWQIVVEQVGHLPIHDKDNVQLQKMVWEHSKTLDLTTTIKNKQEGLFWAKWEGVRLHLLILLFKSDQKGYEDEMIAMIRTLTHTRFSLEMQFSLDKLTLFTFHYFLKDFFQKEIPLGPRLIQPLKDARNVIAALTYSLDSWIVDGIKLDFFFINSFALTSDAEAFSFACRILNMMAPFKEKLSSWTANSSECFHFLCLRLLRVTKGNEMEEPMNQLIEFCENHLDSNHNPVEFVAQSCDHKNSMVLKLSIAIVMKKLKVGYNQLIRLPNGLDLLKLMISIEKVVEKLRMLNGRKLYQQELELILKHPTYIKLFPIK